MPKHYFAELVDRVIIQITMPNGWWTIFNVNVSSVRTFYYTIFLEFLCQQKTVHNRPTKMGAIISVVQEIYHERKSLKIPQLGTHSVGTSTFGRDKVFTNFGRWTLEIGSSGTDERYELHLDKSVCSRTDFV